MSEDSPLNHVPVDNGLASLSLSEEEENRNRKTICEEADRNHKTNEVPDDTRKTNNANTEISYECYSSELQMPDIMRLIQARILHLLYVQHQTVPFWILITESRS
jgi:hypothetical protein